MAVTDGDSAENGTTTEVKEEHSAENEFLKSMTSNLNYNEMHQYVDVNDDWYSYVFNLDPKKIVSDLVAKASEINLSPDTLHTEIAELSRLSRISKPCEEDKKSLDLLSKKYLETYACATSTLKLTFPHYSLGSGVSDLQVSSNTVNIPTAVKEYYCFGALIPTSKYSQNSSFNETRKDLIMIVLFVRHQNSASVTMRTRHILLSKQINTCLLSDDLRVRALENCKVVDMNGKLTQQMQKASNLIKATGFLDQIQLKFFN